MAAGSSTLGRACRATLYGDVQFPSPHFTKVVEFNELMTDLEDRASQ